MIVPLFLFNELKLRNLNLYKEEHVQLSDRNEPVVLRNVNDLVDQHACILVRI